MSLFFFLFLKFYFIFKLYNIVLVLPNIEMNMYTYVFRKDKRSIVGFLVINLTFQMRNPTSSLWNKVTIRHEVLLKISLIEHCFLKCYDSQKRWTACNIFPNNTFKEDLWFSLSGLLETQLSTSVHSFCFCFETDISLSLSLSLCLSLSHLSHQFESALKRLGSKRSMPLADKARELS